MEEEEEQGFNLDNLPQEYHEVLAGLGFNHSRDLLSQQKDSVKFKVPEKIKGIYDQLNFDDTSPIKNVSDFAIKIGTDGSFANDVYNLLEPDEEFEYFYGGIRRELYGPSLFIDNKIPDEDRDLFRKNFGEKQAEAYQPKDITKSRYKELQPYLMQNSNQIIRSKTDPNEYYFIYESEDPNLLPKVKIVNDLRNNDTFSEYAKTGLETLFNVVAKASAGGIYNLPGFVYGLGLDLHEKHTGEGPQSFDKFYDNTIFDHATNLKNAASTTLNTYEKLTDEERADLSFFGKMMDTFGNVVNYESINSGKTSDGLASWLELAIPGLGAAKLIGKTGSLFTWLGKNSDTLIGKGSNFFKNVGKIADKGVAYGVTKTFLESHMEARGDFKKALESKKEDIENNIITEEEAINEVTEAAFNSMTTNMEALFLSNVLEGVIFSAPVFGATGKGASFGKTATRTALGMAVNAPNEFAQEVTQAAISDYVQKKFKEGDNTLKPFSLSKFKEIKDIALDGLMNNQEYMESGIIGAIIGGGVAGVTGSAGVVSNEVYKYRNKDFIRAVRSELMNNSSLLKTIKDKNGKSITVFNEEAGLSHLKFMKELGVNMKLTEELVSENFLKNKDAIAHLTNERMGMFLFSVLEKNPEFLDIKIQNEDGKINTDHPLFKVITNELSFDKTKYNKLGFDKKITYDDWNKIRTEALITAFAAYKEVNDGNIDFDIIKDRISDPEVSSGLKSLFRQEVYKAQLGIVSARAIKSKYGKKKNKDNQEVESNTAEDYVDKDKYNEYDKIENIYNDYLLSMLTMDKKTINNLATNQKELIDEANAQLREINEKKNKRQKRDKEIIEETDNKTKLSLKNRIKKLFGKTSKEHNTNEVIDDSLIIKESKTNTQDTQDTGDTGNKGNRGEFPQGNSNLSDFKDNNPKKESGLTEQEKKEKQQRIIKIKNTKEDFQRSIETAKTKSIEYIKNNEDIDIDKIFEALQNSVKSNEIILNYNEIVNELLYEITKAKAEVKKEQEKKSKADKNEDLEKNTKNRAIEFTAYNISPQGNKVANTTFNQTQKIVKTESGNEGQFTIDKDDPINEKDKPLLDPINIKENTKGTAYITHRTQSEIDSTKVFKPFFLKPGEQFEEFLDREEMTVGELFEGNEFIEIQYGDEIIQISKELFQQISIKFDSIIDETYNLQLPTWFNTGNIQSYNEEGELDYSNLIETIKNNIALRIKIIDGINNNEENATDIEISEVFLGAFPTNMEVTGEEKNYLSNYSDIPLYVKTIDGAVDLRSGKNVSDKVSDDDIAVFRTGSVFTFMESVKGDMLTGFYSEVLGNDQEMLDTVHELLMYFMEDTITPRVKAIIADNPSIDRTKHPKNYHNALRNVLSRYVYTTERDSAAPGKLTIDNTSKGKYITINNIPFKRQGTVGFAEKSKELLKELRINVNKKAFSSNSLDIYDSEGAKNTVNYQEYMQDKIYTKFYPIKLNAKEGLPNNRYTINANNLIYIDLVDAEQLITDEESTTSTPPTEAKKAEIERRVHTATDKKGRIYTYFATTKEKDDLTKTTFTFNRSDKDSSQRSTATVLTDIALGNKYTIPKETKNADGSMADQVPENTTVHSVLEIREWNGKAGATVMFQDKDDTTFRWKGDIVLEINAKYDAQIAQKQAELKALEETTTSTPPIETPQVEETEEIDLEIEIENDITISDVTQVEETEEIDLDIEIEKDQINTSPATDIVSQNRKNKLKQKANKFAAFAKKAKEATSSTENKDETLPTKDGDNTNTEC